MNASVTPMTLLLPGLGMALISMASLLIWRKVSRVEVKWFGVGALLWVVAVALKWGCGLLINATVIGHLKDALRPPYSIAAAGLFIGAESSAFEIGVTWVAARWWPKLGRDAGRAIAIGVGAGAVEALLLSLPLLAGALALLVGVEDAEDIRKTMQTTATTTPLFWLVLPVERLIALLGHASTRALVLLGVAQGKPLMVLGGFLLFASTDGIAGAFLVAGSPRSHSVWWMELAVLPGALVSLPILQWCSRRWPERAEIVQPL
jgi:uncharacterized membrane protein YhfC